MKDIGVLKSYWLESTSETRYSELNEDINVDAVIVGGGMTGIITTYLLCKEGLKVAILEANRILQATTGHTTAKLTSLHGLTYDKLKKNLGEESARIYLEANEYAIEFVERLIHEKGIECDFVRCPAYVYTAQDKYIKAIEGEVQIAESFGTKASFLEEIPLPIEIKAAIRFDNQARFHPRKFLLPLAKDITSDGSYIFENTRAVDLAQGNPNTVITDTGKKVTAKYVVIATHFPFFDGFGLYFTRLLPERSYVIAVKAKEKFPEGLFINAEEPRRSLRSQPFEEGELIFVGGENHITAHGRNFNQHYVSLKDFAVNHYTIEKICYKWSAQDYTTLDELPYIGKLTANTENIFVATGFKKWGMTNSIVSGIIIKDLITKGEHPWAKVYDPGRFISSPNAAKTLVKQNLDVAKNLLQGKLENLPQDIEISYGEGKVLEFDGERIGIYKDDKGSVHMVDTTCTHMGCELKWNDAESSWDCPCHGSRFTYEGNIIDGPAHIPLKHLEEGKNEIDPNIV